MIGQVVARCEQRFHRGEVERGIIPMRRECIAEYLMADFAKDKILAMSLIFWIDIDRHQQDRAIRRRIPAFAVGEDVFIGRKNSNA